MEDQAKLWLALYGNDPPWKTCDVIPLDLPAAIGRELARHALSEFFIMVSGGERAKFLNGQMQNASKNFSNALELGLCLGGVALKPYPDHGRILVDICAADFTPTRFDGSGKVLGGVFRSRPLRQDNEWFIRLEYHDLLTSDDGSAVYTVENRAFRSSQNGGLGTPVPLNSVAEWADLEEHMQIDGLTRPLFAYFKPPGANNIDPGSPLGVSVYAGAVDLIRQADEQWGLLRWEYQSGRRKIYADGVAPEQFHDDLFVTGPFTARNDFFQVFSPEFRDDALYNGFQQILQRIEFSTGLAYGTISDPQSVEKTATEILAAKHRQYVTDGRIQQEFQAVLDDLLYAMDALCSLHGLASAGEYEAVYNWGDGVLDDPETRHQNMALDMTMVDRGLMNAWEFRMKWFDENEETAKKMLPRQGDDKSVTPAAVEEE